MGNGLTCSRPGLCPGLQALPEKLGLDLGLSLLH